MNRRHLRRDSARRLTDTVSKEIFRLRHVIVMVSAGVSITVEDQHGKDITAETLLRCLIHVFRDPRYMLNRPHYWTQLEELLREVSGRYPLPSQT